MKTTREIVLEAWRARTAVPAFNIPYLPMMAPVVRSLRETGSFGLIMVARLEWVKFEARSLRAVYEEYQRVVHYYGDEDHTRLHLDHVPVIDEDGLTVDYEAVLSEAVELGYGSVMVDGSRLPLEENIRATRRGVEIAHPAGVPVEGELGAVMGHEPEGLPLPSTYRELFASGRGFTDPDEARRFVTATDVDWLSVAVGNVHGAISAAKRREKKIEARLHLEHLDRIARAVSVPLVLHGGTGIPSEYIREGIGHGIAKINIATAIRQPYEAAMSISLMDAQDAVYRTMLGIIRDELEIEGLASDVLAPRADARGTED